MTIRAFSYYSGKYENKAILNANRSNFRITVMSSNGRCHSLSQERNLLLLIGADFLQFVSCRKVNYKPAVHTSQIPTGSLVEIIKTGRVICVLKNFSDSIPDTKSRVRKTLESTKFLGEDGQTYGMDEVRILPDGVDL